MSKKEVKGQFSSKATTWEKKTDEKLERGDRLLSMLYEEFCRDEIRFF